MVIIDGVGQSVSAFKTMTKPTTFHPWTKASQGRCTISIAGVVNLIG